MSRIFLSVLSFLLLAHLIVLNKAKAESGVAEIKDTLVKSGNKAFQHMWELGSELPWWIYSLILFFFFSFLFLFFKRRSKRGANTVSTTTKVIPGNAQHIGKRTEQQDAFGFSDVNDEHFVQELGVLAVLADGMGGMNGGREASHLAVQTFLKSYSSANSPLMISEKLWNACHEANLTVFKYAKQNGIEEMAGTTLVAAVILDRQLYWISVGDSRIYLYKDGLLTQLTTDHVYGKELDERAASGQITREDALNHPERNSLISFVGQREMEEIDFNREPVFLSSGDRVILCSDGLYGSLTHEEMDSLLNLDTQECAEKMVEAALRKQKQNQDNVTVAILSVR